MTPICGAVEHPALILVMATTKPAEKTKARSGSSRLTHDDVDTCCTFAEWARLNGYDPVTQTYKSEDQ